MSLRPRRVAKSEVRLKSEILLFPVVFKCSHKIYEQKMMQKSLKRISKKSLKKFLRKSLKKLMKYC